MNAASLDSLESALRKLPIIKNELERLKSELPPVLTYHGVAHTEDVLHECLLFGLHDELSERDLHLLAIAATYHDSGFLVQAYSNEMIGADFASVAMELAGDYTKEEIDLVADMIKDTEIYWGHDGPEFKTSGLLSGYLLDADLSNFGREDFFEKSKLIAQETNQTIEQLNSSLIKFLDNHHWHTLAAQKLRQRQKARNIKLLKKLM